MLLQPIASNASVRAEDELANLEIVQNALESLCRRANERVLQLFELNARRPGQLYRSKPSVHVEAQQQQQRLDVLLENLSVPLGRVRVCMREKPAKGGASTFGVKAAPRAKSFVGGSVAAAAAATAVAKSKTPMRFEEIVQNAAAHHLIAPQTATQERCALDFSRVLSADICPIGNPVVACTRPLFAPVYSLASTYLYANSLSIASKRSSSSSSSSATTRTRPPSLPVSAEIDRAASVSCALLANSQRSLLASPAGALLAPVENDSLPEAVAAWPPPHSTLPFTYLYATLPHRLRHAKSSSPSPPVSTPTPTQMPPIVPSSGVREEATPSASASPLCDEQRLPVRTAPQPHTGSTCSASAETRYAFRVRSI